MADPAGVPVELRVGVDTTEAPYGYDDAPGLLAVDVALAPGGVATLVLDIADAREWAGVLFAAVTVAHRQATGDPHALTDAELGALPSPNRYTRDGAILVHGTQDEPARVRFHIALTVQGHALDTAALAEAIVEALQARFNTVEVLVDRGTPLAGTVTR